MIEEKLKEFDEKFPVSMYSFGEYDEDRDAIKSFLTSFYKDMIEKDIEDLQDALMNLDPEDYFKAISSLIDSKKHLLSITNIK